MHSVLTVYLTLLLYWYMINTIMRHNTVRQRVDPVLAPDQFSCCKTIKARGFRQKSDQIWHLSPTSWSKWCSLDEYVRTHRNKARSISSSTKALESDHARYVTRKIVQHARTMATGTRSLPIDSPIPFFQPIDRGYLSEGSPRGCVCYSLCGSIRTYCQ